MKSVIASLTGILLSVTIVTAQTRGMQCDTDAECGDVMCCVEESQFHIATRRDDKAVDMPQKVKLVRQLAPWNSFWGNPQYGRCSTYNQPGSSCNGFTSCGCVSGYTCKYHYDPPKKILQPLPDLIQTIETRGMIAGSYSRCEKTAA